MGKILRIPASERREEGNATTRDLVIVGGGLATSVTLSIFVIRWLVENLPPILHDTVVYLDESFQIMMRFTS